MAVSQPTLGHSQGDSLTNLKLITAFVEVRLEGHQEPCNEEGLHWGNVKQKLFMHIVAYSEILRHIPTYSEIFRHIPAYLGIFRDI